MSTYTETQPRHTANSPGSRAYGIRHAGVRAFALGAIVATLSVGGAWLASNGTTSTPASSIAGALPEASGAVSSSGSASSSWKVEHSASVAALQRELADLNYYEGPIDGVAGPATVEAIKDFQRANGLAVDGVAGPATTALINRQMKTGDSQMSGSGLPAEGTPTQPGTPANGREPSSTTGGTPTGSSTGGSTSSSGGTSPAKPSGTTGGTSPANAPSRGAAH